MYSVQRWSFKIMLSWIKAVPGSDSLIPTFLHILVISEGILNMDCGCSPLDSMR